MTLTPDELEFTVQAIQDRKNRLNYLDNVSHVQGYATFFIENRELWVNRLIDKIKQSESKL